MLGLATGCPSKTAEAPGASDAAVVADAGAVAIVVDAGPPPPAQLQLVATAPTLDGGVEVVDREIDAVKTLAVRIPTVLSDYRLRVFDEVDRVVPSDDLAHEADAGIDYQITFVEPLKPAKTYRLTVESQTGNALDGYQDAELVFRVRGVPEPDKASKKPRGKKPKRR